MIPRLLLVGIGEGSLLTLLFNVLVSASPKRLAGDVGALRGVANNVSNALGAALASVVAVGLLGLFLALGISRSGLPPELQARVPFSQADFVTDNELRLMLQGTSATAAQVEEAVAINADGWLRALRASFLDRRRHLVVGDLPSRATTEVRARGTVCRGHRERDQSGGAGASLNGMSKSAMHRHASVLSHGSKARPSCARFSRLFGLRGPTIHAEWLPARGSKVSGEGELFRDRDELAVAALRGLA